MLMLMHYWEPARSLCINHEWSWSRCSPCFLFRCLWSSWDFLCVSVGYHIDWLTEVTCAAIASHIPYHHITISGTCGKDDWKRDMSYSISTLLQKECLVLLRLICYIIRKKTIAKAHLCFYQERSNGNKSTRPQNLGNESWSFPFVIYYNRLRKINVKVAEQEPICY